MPDNAVTETSIADLRAMLAPEPENKETSTETPAPTPAKADKSVEKPAPATEPEVIEEATGTERGADGKFKAAAKDDDAPAGVQKRIDKAVKAQREAERERDELKARLVSGSQPAEKAAQRAPPAAPGKPDAAKFETYEAYVEALADWKLDTRDAQRAAAERDRVNAAAWKTREAAAKAAHADYDEVLAGAASLPISLVMHEAIVESEHGAELAYYLATNPEEAARIHALSPNAGAREMGKLELKLAAAPEPSAPSKPAAAVKAPPRPPANVGGSHAPSSVDLNDPKLDQATFNREFRKRLTADRS